MNTVNKIQLIGNLGKDPEIRTFEKGGKLAKFSMATRDYYKNRKGETVEDTQWHFVSAWDKLADRIEAEFKKGSYVNIEGKIVTRKYEDKAGNIKYITEIVAQEAALQNKAS